MGKTKGNVRHFEIREARSEDLPKLVDFLAKLALHVSGGSHQKLTDNEHDRLIKVLQADLLDDDKRIIVAETTNAGLVGMGYVYIWRNQGIWEQMESVEFRSAILDNIWVDPEFRKRGVFKALLQDLVRFAETHHAYELILEYSTSNEEAKAVWTRLGFKPTGVRAAAFTSTVKEALT